MIDYQNHKKIPYYKNGFKRQRPPDENKPILHRPSKLNGNKNK